MKINDNYSNFRLANNFDWKEYFCGWSCGFINVTITYPINKIIFRQMLHGINVRNAIWNIHHEGIYYLYRGLVPPLIQKSCSSSIMFGVYDEIQKPLLDLHCNKYVSKTIAAIMSGNVEAILVPFERVQTLMSDASYHHKFKNTFHAFREIKRLHGYCEFYRGLIPVLLRNGPSNAIFFIAREKMQAYPTISTDSTIRKHMFEFINGAVLGAVLASMFYPLNVVKIQIQSKLGGSYENVFRVFMQIYKDRGSKLRFIYRGVHMNVLRSFFSWGIMNTAYETIKNILN